MTAIVAFGAVSALGEGRAAFAVDALDTPPRVAVARDDELGAAGLARPYVARVRGVTAGLGPGSAPSPGGDDERALVILDKAADGCAAGLDARMPGWRGLRVGLALGTSRGGLRTCEALFGSAEADFARLAAPGTFTYFAGLGRLTARLGLPTCRATLVLGACASSTLALGLAGAWLDEDACDLVLAGGYDAASVFVAAGFEALRATSRSGVMRPFTAERDGLVLGEGAALVALVASPLPLGQRGHVFGYVRGFGATADAVHLTAPDRNGGGLARAATAALRGSGLEPGDIGIVSAHGTATDFNDAAESRAIDAALGPAAAAATLHGFKAQIGHTLGAAGALESLACLDALSRGLAPASAGDGTLMEGLSPRRLAVAEPSTARSALKLSAAFGGANASLVLSLDPPTAARPRATRRVFATRAVHVDREPTLEELCARSGTREKLSRTDRVTRLTLGALAALSDAEGPLEGAGIVVAQGLAAHETNALYWDTVKRRGARFAEPRRFPFTSPNAPCGECAIAFHLTGPGFAVGLGSAAGIEALSVAATLVRAGHAERMVVVAVDDVGPASAPSMSGPSGAVALVVTAEADWTEVLSAEVWACALPGAPRAPLSPAHVALLPLAATAPADCLECGPSWGVFGKVRLRAAGRGLRQE